MIKMQKMWHYIDYEKDTCWDSMRAWKKAVLLCSTSARTWCIRQLECFATPYMAAKVHKSTTRTDFRVTNESWQVGEFTNMESTNNEDDCVSLKKANTTRNQKGHCRLKGTMFWSKLEGSKLYLWVSKVIFHTASARRCLSAGVSEHATSQLWQMPTQVHLHIYTKKDNSKRDQSWLVSLKLPGYSSTVPLIAASQTQTLPQQRKMNVVS